MAVLSDQEFQEQSSSGKNSLERVYQGKAIASGPIFSLVNLKPASQYCQNFTQAHPSSTCIIVREKSFLRIWSEVLQDGSVNLSSSKKLEKAKLPEPPKSLPIDTGFIAICQRNLAEFIGPVAPIICKKILAKHKNLTRKQFVCLLAKKISDPQDSEKFQSSLL